MPDTKTNTTDPNFEQFYIRIKAGLAAVEQDARGYKSVNPTSKAMGKYQFLPSWLNGSNGIKAFAKNNPAFGKIETEEDFLNNPELQEAFFKYYAKNTLYKEAKAAISGKNPLNLSLDQAGAIFHFDSPEKAKQQISSGRLKPATKKGVNGAKHDNLSGADYQKRYIKGLASIGMKPMSSSITMTPKEKQKVIDDFEKQNSEIDKLDVDNGVKEKLRAKLYQEVVLNGNRDIVNNYLEDENKKKDEEVAKIENLKKVLDGAEMKYRRPNSKKSKNYTLSSIYIEDANKEDIEKAIKDFPEIMKNGTHLSTGGFVVSTPDATKNFIESLNAKEKELGYDISKRDPNGGSILNNLNNILPDFLQDATGGALRIETFSSSTAKIGEVQKRALIDPEHFPDPEVKYEEDETKVTENKKSGETAPSKPKTENDDVEGSLADEFFNTELGLYSVKPQDFNYGKTKRDFPVDTIMGLTLGLIGNKQAQEAKIPLRTEEVSSAIKTFTSDLAKKVKEGIPVEVEAAMRSKLAEVAQGALENIVNSSAGNRATVLGNLGQVDNMKAKGLLSIAVADYEAKDRAFKEYGEAIKYINDFDTRRDIANHAIEYGEGLRKRQKGEELAEAGFSQMVEGIKYDKENGPGSANDMYRSLLMQKAFGFDPKQKDDGSGTVPGTQSYYDAKKMKTLEEETKTKGLYQRMQRMNPNQKKGLDIFIGSNTDKDNIGSFMDYIEQNPNIDYSKISMDNIDLALKENNFGLLGKRMLRNGKTGEQLNDMDAQEAADMYDPNATGIIKLTDQQINSAENTAEKQMGLLNAYPEGALSPEDAQSYADILTYGQKQ